MFKKSHLRLSTPSINVNAQSLSMEQFLHKLFAPSLICHPERGSELLYIQQFNLIPLLSHSLSTTISDLITQMHDQSRVISFIPGVGTKKKVGACCILSAQKLFSQCKGELHSQMLFTWVQDWTLTLPSTFALKKYFSLFVTKSNSSG